MVQISCSKDQCSGISSCPHQRLFHIFGQMLAVCVHNSHRAIFPQFCPYILKGSFNSLTFGLSFHTQWISILFLLSMVWSTIDYGKSINEITEKKVIAEILCICCIALSIAIAYFVGYIQGTFVSI